MILRAGCNPVKELLQPAAVVLPSGEVGDRAIGSQVKNRNPLTT